MRSPSAIRRHHGRLRVAGASADAVGPTGAREHGLEFTARRDLGVPPLRRFQLKVAKCDPTCSNAVVGFSGSPARVLMRPQIRHARLPSEGPELPAVLMHQRAGDSSWPSQRPYFQHVRTMPLQLYHVVLSFFVCPFIFYPQKTCMSCVFVIIYI